MRPAGEIEGFIKFTTICRKFERADILAKLSSHYIRNASRDFGSSADIRHFSRIINLAHCCTGQQCVGFLDRCFSQERLEEQYLSSQSQIGSLAGAVYAVACNDDVHVRRWFRKSALVQRLWYDFPASSRPPEYTAAWLQLLGGVYLLGKITGEPPRRRLSSVSVDKAVSRWEPDSAREGIGPIQSALWLGLREWCHLSGQSFQLNERIANIILEQCYRAEPVEKIRSQQVNVIIIEWIERCKINKWASVAENYSIQDALKRLEN